MKVIDRINGPVVKARGDTDIAMQHVALVGHEKLLGEVIGIDGDEITLQVYESTSGLRPGEPVVSTDQPLSVTLGPGIIGHIFDGIQRPLEALYRQTGDFMGKGVTCAPLDREKPWHFTPCITEGEPVTALSFLGEVPETGAVTQKIMVPYGAVPRGETAVIESIAAEGEYTINDSICRIKLSTGEIKELTMCHEWSVREPRPFVKKMGSDEPLITGQRVIDTLFPLARGGTASIPGSFGTGKTMTQHQLAQWCDADIIIYIGCGERGNEMTEVLEDFPKLQDPRTGRSLMERTVLIANTSNMPVAAREASIYTGMTLAEYYRDMGYDVAIMADSTSRWAEALREISGRLEEMPAEEGFPPYLPSRLSEFYGRAGKIESLNGSIGSVSVIGAVSPPGGDFSEPVTQHTKRYIRCFWGLDRQLAYARHYPAIHWLTSYSEYKEDLASWYTAHVHPDFIHKRNQMVRLLQEESDLMEIVKLVGADVLPEEQKLVLEVCRVLRTGFLQQNAFHPADTCVPLEKQYAMMDTMLYLYDRSLVAVKKGIPVSVIKELGYFDRCVSIKYLVSNDNLFPLADIKKAFDTSLTHLQKEYEST